MQLINKMDLANSELQNTSIYSVETFDRAFPTSMDGLKPIHKRILFTMWKRHVYSLTKVSTVCGACLEFHPHGDSSVYGALVRMAQPWVMNYPYVYIEGNKGDQSGSVPAAGRYLMCKLDKFADDVILSDLDEVSVDYEDNFDYLSKVPKYVPSKIPLILINGISGIGVAFKCDMPPHNLNDVADCCIMYIKNKSITNEKLCEGFYPDFPTGGEILNGDEVSRFYKYGEPCVVSLRGKAILDTTKNMIVLTEFPYGIAIDDISSQIANAVKDGNMILSGITSIIDNNHVDENMAKNAKKQQNTTYEYQCKKEANIMEILNEICRVSQFKTSIQMNFMVNYDGYPRPVNVKDIIAKWYEVRVDTIRRRHQRNITLAQEKLHLYEGILSIYDRKEEVVSFISKSKAKSKEDVIIELHKRFGVTKTQARGIYEMPLGTLNGFGQSDLENKIKVLHDNIMADDYILTHIDETIIKDLNDLKAKYGRPRRTLVTMNYQEKASSKPVVTKGSFLYSYTSLGLYDVNGCKDSKGLLSGLRAYKINGKGVREVCGGSALEGTPEGFVVCYSDSTIQIISSNVFKIVNVWYDTKCDEKDASKHITAACAYYSNNDELVCLTNDFKVKRISVKELGKRAVNSGGIITNIVRSDPESEKLDCLMVGNKSPKGPIYSLVPLSDIPLLGRSAGGVKTAFDPNGDLKVNMILLDIGSEDTERLFVGTSDKDGQGYIHSIPLDALKITGRTNKPKILALPVDQEATGLILGDVGDKEKILCMIGKNSTSTLSVTNFKKQFSFKRTFLNTITGDVF